MDKATRERAAALELALRHSPAAPVTGAVAHWVGVFDLAERVRAYLFDGAVPDGAGVETESSPKPTPRRRPRKAKASSSPPASGPVIAPVDGEPKRIGWPPKQGEFTTAQLRMARAIIDGGAHSNVILAQKMGLSPEVGARLWKAATEEA